MYRYICNFLAIAILIAAQFGCGKDAPPKELAAEDPMGGPGPDPQIESCDPQSHPESTACANDPRLHRGKIIGKISDLSGHNIDKLSLFIRKVSDCSADELDYERQQSYCDAPAIANAVGEHGDFVVRNLHPGTYEIDVRQDYTDKNVDAWKATVAVDGKPLQIAVKNNTVADIGDVKSDVVALTLVTIRGRLVHNKAGAVVPLVDTKVSLRFGSCSEGKEYLGNGTSCTFYYIRDRDPSSTTNIRGEFQFPQTVPWVYALEVGESAGGIADTVFWRNAQNNVQRIETKDKTFIDLGDVVVDVPQGNSYFYPWLNNPSVAPQYGYALP